MASNAQVQCIKAKHAGDAEVLVNCEFPLSDLKLGATELLVSTVYAGVNFVDTYYRMGLYPKPNGFPFVVGEEGCGIVIDVGSDIKKKEEWINKRVAFFKNTSGSYATYVKVDQRDAFLVPQCVEEADAAAVMLQGCTAHYLTHDTYPVKAGDVVLVHAAAGGTGLLITQMAKACGAALVIGVCGGAKKAEVACTVGKCDAVVDYLTDTDWVAAVMRIIAANGGKACNVVYDGVGKNVFKDSLKCLRRRGHMVSFGNASGAVEPIAPLDLMRSGSLYLTRPTLADYMLTREEAEARVAGVLSYVSAGTVKLTIAKVFALNEATEAHKYIEGKQSIGKVLLKCQ